MELHIPLIFFGIKSQRFDTFDRFNLNYPKIFLKDSFYMSDIGEIHTYKHLNISLLVVNFNATFLLL